MKPVPWYRVELVVLLCLVAGSLPADTLVVGTNHTTSTGTFEAFKTDKFCFKTDDGKSLREAPKTVRSLTVDPPARCTLKPKGKKAIENVRIHGYDGVGFTFVSMSGQELSMKLADVSLIQIDKLDIGRASTLAMNKNLVTPQGEDAMDFESLVQTNVVTVLHIHVKDETSAERVIMYVNTVARDSHGKIVVKKIDIGDWTSATARKYAIKSAPQFWVHDRAGNLVRKITDFRSPEEVAKIIEQARH